MKKIFALVIALSIMLGLCACAVPVDDKGKNSTSNVDYSSSFILDTSSIQSSNDTANESNSEQTDVSSQESVSSDNASSKASQSKPSSSNSTSSKTQVSSSQQSSTQPAVTNAVHKALAESEYYQFSCMNTNEKKLYARLNDSAQKFENYTNAADLNMTVAEATSVMKRFVADHPQYFWISDQISVTYYLGSDKAEECIFKYSDGTITDDLDSKEANRNTIKSKKAKVEAKAKEIISKIDPKASDYEKELQIHDVLANLLKYDKDAEKTPSNNGTLKSALDVYGALVENKAICEGYTKSFQYLCYLVGINANQVVSKNHMWNVVKIGGEWYQVDLTWDDPIAKKADGTIVEMVVYDYFNLTTKEMNKDHTPAADSYIKVPNCTATKYKYKK